MRDHTSSNIHVLLQKRPQHARIYRYIRLFCKKGKNSISSNLEVWLLHSVENRMEDIGFQFSAAREAEAQPAQKVQCAKQADQMSCHLSKASKARVECMNYYYKRFKMHVWFQCVHWSTIAEKRSDEKILRTSNLSRLKYTRQFEKSFVDNVWIFQIMSWTTVNV